MNDERQHRFHMLRTQVKEECGHADEHLSLSRHELELFGMAQTQNTWLKAAALVKAIDRESGCEALASIREMVLEHYPNAGNERKVNRPDSAIVN